MLFHRWCKMMCHVVERIVKDFFSHHHFSKKRDSDIFNYQIVIKQPFKPSSTLSQKKLNLNIASKRIRKHIIKSGEVFSFWRAVGNPNKSEFAESRGIRGGVLQLERGGGLCQASGIIYHLSLIAGFEILERYNHSKDIYTDETRFCPLGSDATVSYGYRDLRIRNNSDTSVYFDLRVGESDFIGTLCSEKELIRHEISFEYALKDENVIEAVTIDKSNGQIIATSKYEKIDNII